MTSEEIGVLRKNQFDAWKYYIGRDIQEYIELKDSSKHMEDCWELHLKGFSKERILDYFEIVLADNMSLMMIFQIRNNNKKIKYGGWIQIDGKLNFAIGDSTVQSMLESINEFGLEYHCKNAKLHKIRNETLGREELNAVNVICDAHNTSKIPIMILNLDLDKLPQDDMQLSKLALSTLIDGEINTLSTEQIKHLIAHSKRDSVVYKA